MSTEILPELKRARDELSRDYHGNRYSRVGNNSHPKTWAQYCEDIGITKRYANKLLADVHKTSLSSEWTTPETIITKTIQLFETIDLDPCSNSYTDPNVPAEQHYTVDDNGLTQPWHGRVYMNPPYGKEIDKWTEKLRIEYEEGRTIQGIALVPSRTDTGWFRGLSAYPRCFLWGRLRFSEYRNSAPFPSMVVYLGQSVGKFAKIFFDIGDIYARIDV